MTGAGSWSGSGWSSCVAVGACAAAFSGQTNNKFEVPGHRVPAGAGAARGRSTRRRRGTYARVVFAAPEGETLKDADNAKAVEATMAEASKAAEVSGVSEVTLSKDGTIGYADVIYPVPSGEIGEEARQELADVADTGEAAGLQVEFSGGIAAEEAHHGSESMGMIVAFFVLAITLGVAAGRGHAADHRRVRRRDRHHRPDRALRRDRAVRDRPDPGHDARPGRRHRLRAVHPRAPQAEPRRRHGRARVRRPGDRHRRQRRRVRRHDRRDRARRPGRHQHPVPHRHGPGRGRHRDDRRARRDHAAARRSSASAASRLGRANRLFGPRRKQERTPVSARWVGFVTRHPIARPARRPGRRSPAPRSPPRT